MGPSCRTTQAVDARLAAGWPVYDPRRGKARLYLRCTRAHGRESAGSASLRRASLQPRGRRVRRQSGARSAPDLGFVSVGEGPESVAPERGRRARLLDQPRRDAAEMPPRCRRDVAEMSPRCRRDVAEIQPIPPTSRPPLGRGAARAVQRDVGAHQRPCHQHGLRIDQGIVPAAGDRASSAKIRRE